MSAAVLGAVVVLSGAVALASVVTQRNDTTAQGTPAPSPSTPPSLVPAVPAATPSARPTTLSIPTRRATAKPRPTRTAEPVVVRPSAPVLVLNNSTVSGLAARSADRVRNAGFAVTGVGNLHGRYETTTVFYRPGYAEQAWLLAGRLRGMQNVRPAPAGLPGATALTLAVTADFRN
ncbi:MAG: hypothetical protein QOC93_1095 [Actinomycetota bacterium]|jgi:hypothetical protein|nr:hypothetical protein [Cryptosporangiaceae bacterium]MDQ1675951.1 hypothetical protein [Actinomycetota bacterium]